MPAFALLLSLALQNDMGWRCSAERAVDGRVYWLSQSMERGHRFPRDFQINWMSETNRVERFLQWDERRGLPPAAPREVSFWMPASGRTSRVTLRMSAPDGAEYLVRHRPWAGLNVSLASSPRQLLFLSLDRDLNRELWAAGRLHVAAEDWRRRNLGALDLSWPAAAEVTRIAAELAREVDAKLGDPANPTHHCTGYGRAVRADPA